jgi:hypothetical protein
MRSGNKYRNANDFRQPSPVLVPMTGGRRADDAVGEWMRHMRSGDWERAWRISDSLRPSSSDPVDWTLPRNRLAIWRGAPLEGKRVLIRCYHGLGDTIHFIRYAPLVAGIAREVTVCAQPGLLPLLERVPGIDRLVPLLDDEPRVEHGVDVEVMELPYLFRTTPETVPSEVPYLDVAPAPRRADGTLAVGLVWRAGDWDAHRSVPVALLEPLATLPGITLHVLQRGEGLAERPGGFGVLYGSDDPLETARRMRSLDLVVTVDSMPAHLAGALGVPVWTMLRANADWRWMEGREDTPWYPTMRLIRQEEEGDWGPVVARVVRGLRERREGAGIEPGVPPR